MANWNKTVRNGIAEDLKTEYSGWKIEKPTEKMVDDKKGTPLKNMITILRVLCIFS